MLRKITMAVLILFCFLLQVTLFRSLAFAGIVPNLLIVLTSSFGFMRGEKEGLLIGFFSGILCDIFFADMLGFYALVYMYIGFLNGKFCKIFYPEDIKLPLALITVSDLSYGIICYVLLFLLRGRLNFLFYLRTVILPETVYTIVITCLLYPLALFVNNRLEGFERKRAKKFV
ncbi:MAG: rod shape-determining protein MreD [Acetatifactor sp.]|nr:rod shape-determining protein MreD [Lachnospiraceae bacterium]MDE5747527.1 rod shape-determining protein MreD [Acetatifactor sp.]MDE5950846.1 rod shape-determining protein MreD [Acetatifactor sp.]